MSVLNKVFAPAPSNPDDVRMTLGEHLEELRTRLIRALIGLFVGTVVCYMFIDYLQAFLMWPVFAIYRSHGLPAEIRTMAPAEQFMTDLKVALIIGLIVAYALWKEKYFTEKGTNLFDSFVHGAKDGFTTGLRVLPYMIAMLAALSIFRNSGLMGIVMDGLSAMMAAATCGSSRPRSRLARADACLTQPNASIRNGYLLIGMSEIGKFSTAR